MTVSRPTGQDPQSKLLWDILRQLDRLSGIVASGGGGGAVTIANGADSAEGFTTNAYNLATDGTAVTVISLLKAVSYLLQNALKVGIADGADVTLGAKADAKSAATDTTAITLMQVAKEISYLLQNSLTVTEVATADGTQKTQLVGATGNIAVVSPANTARANTDKVLLVQTIAADGTIGGGSAASAVDDAPFAVATDKGTPIMGIVTTDQVNDGDQGALAMTLGRELKVYEADGSNVTLGAKADAKSAATDTTAISIMSVLKEVSYLLQNSLATTIVNGGNVTLGNTADAKNSATDTTAVTAISLFKEISYLLQSVESAANTGRTTATVVVPTQLVGPSGYPADVNISNELKTFNPPAAMLSEYRSPTDFAVAFTSNVNLTVTGAPFTVDDSVCRIQSIIFKKVDGLFYGLYNARGGVSISCAAGVITVAGAGTPFTNTDTVYDVNIIAQKKAYDLTTDTLKITNQNPDSLQYVLDSIVDTTNTAAATVYYPSSLGMVMDGYKDMSITGRIIDGSTVTLTVESSNDEDSTNANWIQIYGYDSKNNVMTNSLATTDATFAWDFDNMNYSIFRIKVIYGSSTNTGIIKMRRKAL